MSKELKANKERLAEIEQKIQDATDVATARSLATQKSELSEKIELEEIKIANSVKDSEKLEVNVESARSVSGELSLEDKAELWQGWTFVQTKQSDLVSSRQIELARRHNFDLNRGNFYFGTVSARANQTIGTPAAGGYVATPSEFGGLIVQGSVPEGVRKIASIIHTDKGNDLEFPSNNDTAEATVIGELNGGSDVTSTDLAFVEPVVVGEKRFNSNVYMVSNKLIRDAAINIPQFVYDRLVGRVDRKENNLFTAGYIADLVASVTSEAVNAFTFDDVIDLWKQLKPKYRANAKWVMNRYTLAYLMKQVNDNGTFVFLDNIKVGPNYSMLGSPIEINDSMDHVESGASKVVMTYGDHAQALLLRDIGSQSFQALTDSKFALRDAVGYTMCRSADCKLINSEAILALALDAS